MEIDFSLLPKLIIFAIFLLIIYMYAYRRYVYSVIDPLFIFTIVTAFASVLVTQVVQNTWDIVHFFACQLALLLGFAIAYRKTRLDKIDKHESYEFTDETLLYWTTYFLLFIYVSSNIFVAYSKGLSLLSDSPTEAKVANFQNGFGFFRKINWGVGTFVVKALVYIYLRSKKYINLIFLLIIVCFSALDGSKSAILGIVVSAGFILYHPHFQKDQQLIRKFQRYFPILLILVLSVFFTVLIKENDNFDAAIIGFFQRLLYSGDSVIYYYIPVNIDYFANYSPWDYISRITNPILGLFRLQEYKEALGNIMVENLRPPNSAGGIIVGPNTPYYIEGRIYFGLWGAIPYCSLVGYIYAKCRIYYFSIVKSSAFYFILMASFCHLISALLTDVNLAVTQSFDMFLFVVPAYLLMSLGLLKKISIKPTLVTNT